MNKILSKNWFWLVVILLATFFSYFTILSFDFVYWDDDKQIINNIYVKILNWENCKHNFFYERFTFIPLTVYSFVYHFFADKAFVYHLGSILFHLLNIWSVYMLLKKMNFSSFVVMGSVLIFALHPLRIESVAWISEWKDLLFTFFFLWGLNFYLTWINREKVKYLLLYIIMAWLSGFSKVQGILLPFSCILLDYFMYRRIRIKAIVFHLIVFAWVLLSSHFKIWYSALFIAAIYYFYFKKEIHVKWLIKFKPAILLSIIVVIITLAFFYRWLWFWTGSSFMNFSDRIVFSGYSLFFYIQQFIFPFKQLAIHQYPIFSGLELWKEWGWYILTWFFIIATIFIVIKSSLRNKHWILFGIFFFLLNISIVLHFIPIEGRLIVAERYSYLAYLGLIISSTMLVEVLIEKRKKIRPLLFTSLLILFSILTYNRTLIWKNTETLFKDVILKEPTTSFAWVNLGSYYLENKKYQNANYCYLKAKQYNPNDVQIYLNQALSNLALKNISLAFQNIEEGIRRSTTNEDVSMFLVTKGQIYEQIGKYATAMSLYNEALLKYPQNFKALLQKSMLYANDLKIRNIDSAIYYAQKAISINKFYADAYHTLGWLYLTKSDIEHSISNINKSIELNPMSPLPYNSLGYISLLKNDVNAAIEYYSKAISLDSSLVEVIKNRAWAYYQTKQYSQALIDYNRVLSVVPNDYIALVNAGFCCTYLKNNNQAVLHFHKVNKLFPDSIINTYNLAWVFLQAKSFDSAIVYYNKYLDKNPLAIQPIFERGYAFFAAKNYEKALIDFTKVRDLNPENGEVYFWLGETEYAMGHNNLACDAYETAKNKGYTPAIEKIKKYCKKNISLGN